LALLVIGAAGMASAQAQAREIRVGVVTDGPAGRAVFSPEVIEREVRNVVGSDLSIVLPENKRFAGDWTRAGVNAALDRALADKQVDVVLPLGILGSHEAGHRTALTKPIIAPFVIDPMLQTFPLVQGTSGRKNFTYVADFHSVANEVKTFHDVVGFKHLA